MLVNTEILNLFKNGLRADWQKNKRKAGHDRELLPFDNLPTNSHLPVATDHPNKRNPNPKET